MWRSRLDGEGLILTGIEGNGGFTATGSEQVAEPPSDAIIVEFRVGDRDDVGAPTLTRVNDRSVALELTTVVTHDATLADGEAEERDRRFRLDTESRC